MKFSSLNRVFLAVANRLRWFLPTIVVLCAVPFFSYLTSTAHAAITWSGNVSPDDPSGWGYTTEGSVGYVTNGTGTVTVNNDYLKGGYSYLGRASGSTGTVTITGAASKWDNSGDLTVGFSGSGTLNIEAGGQVSNIDGYYSGYSGSGYLGYNSGSTGTATVKDTGSMWTNTGGDICVGNSGSGTLNIEAGGQVDNCRGFLGYNSGSTGTATVKGTDSKWINSGFNNALFVGYYGGGTLNIEAGGLVYDTRGYLGRASGSTGMATVTGTGSTWTNSNDLTISNGTLKIAAGGQVSSIDSFLGSDVGNGTSTATVTGINSKWTNTDRLVVSGRGTLNIEASGQASSYRGCVGYYSTGTATVTGTGSTWTNTDSLCIGEGDVSSGTLNIKAGGQVNSIYVYLGHFLGSTGTATVTGTGSKWTNSDNGHNPTFSVGYFGSGTLNIEAGGQVSNVIGILGNASGSTGTATVTGDGSKWTNSGYLYVGSSGSGTLNIAAGGQVSNTEGSLGTGTATVTGTGSKWTNTGHLLVASTGGSTLNITAGGQVSNTTGYLSYSSDTTGTATVTGTGSTWTNTESLTVGTSYLSSGTLNIKAGGQVSNTEGYLGYYSGSTGTATVTGTDSKWTNSSGLVIGRDGRGTLNITNGGVVTATSVSINSQSLLAMDVSNSGMLTIGGGSGSITNNGTVRINAGAGLAVGTYFPILATWGVGGTYQAFGGTWDATFHTFTVSAAQRAATGDSVTITQSERVLFGSGGTGSVGATSNAASLTLKATAISGTTLSDLQDLSGIQSVLGGWEFVATDYTSGNPVYLSFNIGPGYSPNDLQIWHYDGTWEKYAATDLTYDGTYASFTVNGFSGYAITPTPEPSTLALLVTGLLGLLAYAWRRRRR